jgi:hypothetical protein
MPFFRAQLEFDVEADTSDDAQAAIQVIANHLISEFGNPDNPAEIVSILTIDKEAN